MTTLEYQTRIKNLCDIAIEILNDECPRDQNDYLCAGYEDYDESICKTCWAKQIFKAANGQGGI